MVFGMEKSTQYSSPSCDFTWSNLILNQLNKMFHQDTIICLFVKEIKRVWEAPWIICFTEMLIRLHVPNIKCQAPSCDMALTPQSCADYSDRKKEKSGKAIW